MSSQAALCTCSIKKLASVTLPCAFEEFAVGYPRQVDLGHPRELEGSKRACFGDSMRSKASGFQRQTRPLLLRGRGLEKGERFEPAGDETVELFDADNEP